VQVILGAMIVGELRQQVWCRHPLGQVLVHLRVMTADQPLTAVLIQQPGHAIQYPETTSPVILCDQPLLSLTQVLIVIAQVPPCRGRALFWCGPGVDRYGHTDV